MSDPAFREAWVYESIVDALPGRTVPTRWALASQFVGFELAVVVLAAYYDLWGTVPAATAAILVATLGSGLLVRIGDTVRASDAPQGYRRMLFDSSIEIVLTVVAYAVLLTYLLVGPGDPIGTVLGENPPPLAVFLGLVVAWDVCYRIGIGWWASVVGCWRSMTEELSPATADALWRADATTLGFALLQLVLVPFLWDLPLLALAVLGHVGAVTFVSGLSLLLLRTSLSSA